MTAPPWYRSPPPVVTDHSLIAEGIRLIDHLVVLEGRPVVTAEDLLQAAQRVMSVRQALGTDPLSPAFPVHEIVLRSAMSTGRRIVVPGHLRRPIPPTAHVHFDLVAATMAQHGIHAILVDPSWMRDAFWAWPWADAGIPQPPTLSASVAILRHGVLQLLMPWACDRDQAPPIPRRLLDPAATLRTRLRRLPSLRRFAVNSGLAYPTLHRLAGDDPEATASVPFMQSLAIHLCCGIRWVAGRPA